MHWVEKPGTSLDAMRRITMQASKELRAIPGVRNFGSHIGRAEVADEVVGPELHRALDQPRPEGRLRGDRREDPGGRRRLPRPLPRPADLPEGAHQGGAHRRQRHDRGADLRARPRRAAREGAGGRAGDRRRGGVADLKVEPQVLVPQIDVRLRPDAAAQLRPHPRRRAPGRGDAGQGHEGRGDLRGAEDLRRGRVGRAAPAADLAALRELLIETPSGAQVPLGDVADVVIAPAPNEIKREDASRRIDVTCNVRGATWAASRARSRRASAQLSFERGLPPRVPGRVRGPLRRRAPAAGAVGALAGGHPAVLYVDFRSLG